MQKHILITDDDDAIRCIVAFVLKDAGYKVSQAQDGLEALELILEKQEEEDSFDLLLTDNEMPRLSGTELVCELKRKQVSLPTIVVSGSLDRELISRLLINGCFDIIKKPFDIRELNQKVALVFQKTKVKLRTQEKVVHDLQVAV